MQSRRLTASTISFQYLRTHHPAAVHSPLRALPALRLRLRPFTDGENAPCWSWALFSPVRCRTHACTSTTGDPPRCRQTEGEMRPLFSGSCRVLCREGNEAAQTPQGWWIGLSLKLPRELCGSSPEQDRETGRTDPQHIPQHPSREESHLQPLLKAETEASPSSDARSRVRGIQREPTAKQVVTPPAPHPDWHLTV